MRKKNQMGRGLVVDPLIINKEPYRGTGMLG
jgi:hypothetical protein